MYLEKFQFGLKVDFVAMISNFNDKNSIKVLTIGIISSTVSIVGNNKERTSMLESLV